MTGLLRVPHRLYKQYQSAIESLWTVIGLALLTATVLINIPVYPPNWAPVLLTIIVIVGWRWPLAGYILAVATALYPLYTVSIYLMLLFVAVAIVGHRPFSHYLGATVLVLATPFLAHYHLHWMVPVLAGLWWGAMQGLWIGGAAALWGKLLFGMTGLSIDWLLIPGASPSAAAIMQRYSGLGAIETLSLLGEPFLENPTMLLYHLLQIGVWALAAGIVGALTSQSWAANRRAWGSIMIASIGVGLLVTGEILLAQWLLNIDPMAINFEPLILAALAALILSSVLDMLRYSLDLPTAPQPKRWKVKQPPALEPVRRTQPSTTKPAAKPTAITLPDLPEWEPPTDNNDLILLELD